MSLKRTKSSRHPLDGLLDGREPVERRQLVAPQEVPDGRGVRWPTDRLFWQERVRGDELREGLRALREGRSTLAEQEIAALRRSQTEPVRVVDNLDELPLPQRRSTLASSAVRHPERRSGRESPKTTKRKESAPSPSHAYLEKTGAGTAESDDEAKGWQTRVDARGLLQRRNSLVGHLSSRPASRASPSPASQTQPSSSRRNLLHSLPIEPGSHRRALIYDL